VTLTGSETDTNGTHDQAHAHRAADLEAFNARVDDVVHSHSVVVDNRYTKWFAKGEATRDEVRHLATQFSVFSHLFVEAQLRKVINAADVDTYRAGKEILMNELGVIFRPTREIAPAEGTDPELVSTEGTIRQPTSNGCCASPRHSGSSSRTWASVATAPRRRCSSATSCSASTARRTPRRPKGPRTRSSTGRRPASGRS